MSLEKALIAWFYYRFKDILLIESRLDLALAGDRTEDGITTVNILYDPFGMDLPPIVIGTVSFRMDSEIPSDDGGPYAFMLEIVNVQIFNDKMININGGFN